MMRSTMCRIHELKSIDKLTRITKMEDRMLEMFVFFTSQQGHNLYCDTTPG